MLLNTLEKLFEKMLANQMQLEAQKHSIFHPNQFGGVHQHSTEDVGVYLMHIVKAGWAKGLKLGGRGAGGTLTAGSWPLILLELDCVEL